MKIEINTIALKRMKTDLKEMMNNVLSSRSLLDSIGDIVKTDIVVYTRSGKSTVTGNDFIDVGEKWKRIRKSISQFNPIHPAARITGYKSNLTYTGQLLDSLGYSITSDNSLMFEFSGMHKKYDSKRGMVGDAISNADLAEKLEKEGRPFVGLREIVKKRAEREVIAYLRRGLRVYNATNK